METNPAASTLILLIRHGATPTTGQVLPGRAPGLHLSDVGQKQADEVAQRLHGLPLTAVYTSPMERAQETAAPTAAHFGVGPQVTDDLIECEFGDWTGSKLTDLYKLPEWKTVQQTPSQFRFPGGESFPEMQQRMADALDRIAARHPGEVVALFSHADPLKAAVAHIGGTPLDSFQRISIDTASISVAEFNTPPLQHRMVVTNSRTGSLSYLRSVGADQALGPSRGLDGTGLHG
ncbi:Phosphoserine phosphatase 1 [Corynebacterium faecale]|uniref:histidine phosphatase family protein n=1 Tax=Corynebacterium faecale TaxID=1758466 RepID=UPI0025B3F547|nr:histidine phosphatase family protein [Corynebacterium faecale]WJY91776.1 Phosphoserine phosphatase 1 [Corynebacterium faecale]